MLLVVVVRPDVVDTEAQTRARRQAQPAKVSLASIDGRLARLRELFALADISRDEYMRRRDALLADRRAIETPTETLEQRSRSCGRSSTTGTATGWMGAAS